jgi:regulator of protease activity HflC (stomatin/prohibitin superfamily)
MDLISENLNAFVAALALLLGVIVAAQGIRVVPQSQVFVIERFGRYTRTLSAGLNFIVPFLDQVAHRVSVLEMQRPEFRISVITRDNVEVGLKTTVFYRRIDAAKSVYRIANVDNAIDTAATSIVRSAAGKLDLDDLQSSRESMNDEIARNLALAAEIWGIEITRSEITDVEVDAETKEAQRQQLNAERSRRATIAIAEGEKRATELRADAEFYQAQRAAEAVRVNAEAEAFAVEVAARAAAEQTRLLAAAIREDGQSAVDFEVRKRQIEAIAQLASATNTKTLVLPTNVTGVLGALEALSDGWGQRGS